MTRLITLYPNKFRSTQKSKAYIDLSSAGLQRNYSLLFLSCHHSLCSTMFSLKIYIYLLFQTIKRYNKNVISLDQSSLRAGVKLINK